MVGKEKKKAPAAHPTYQEMVLEGLKNLKDRKGCTRQSLIKFLLTNYKLEKNVNVHLKMALARLRTKGIIETTKFGGAGLCGRFKIKIDPAQEKKPKAKKPKTKVDVAKQAKKVVKKSSAAKKSPKKKVAKKPKSPAKKKSSKPKVAKKQSKSPQKKQKIAKPATKKTKKPKTAATKKKSKN